MSSSSSDDDDILKYASVALSGDDVIRGASNKEKRKRVESRTDKSAGPNSMVDDPQSGKTLDATQLRVAVALEQRLEKDLQMCENVYDSSKGTSDSSALDRDDSLEKPGVLLFWPGRVKRKNSAGANLPVTKRYIKANSVSSDDGDAMEDLLSVVVEPTDLLKQAERVALQARLNVAPVNPTSDDEGGKAKRRKRKREKEELALQMKWQETGGELTNKNYS